VIAVSESQGRQNPCEDGFEQVAVREGVAEGVGAQGGEVSRWKGTLADSGWGKVL